MDAMPNHRRRRIVAYAIGLAVGLAAVFVMLAPATIAGTGGLWVAPVGDLAQNLTGHLAVQAHGWQWPPLMAPDLAAPRGMSAAMTDSNPLASILAKGLAGLTRHPVNLFPAWLAACWLLQPVAAVFAVRSLPITPMPGAPGPRGWEAALAAAVLAATFPALLTRFVHINLLGHFCLLLALGLALRLTVRPSARLWWAAGFVLLVAVLAQPYLFLFAAALLAGPALQAAGRRSLWEAGAFLLAAGLPVLAYKLLSGTVGAGDRGFGFYSMNLLSPVWPQRSGLFGDRLPILDGTGGQYEGFCYLGGGGLLLLAVAALPAWRGFVWRRWWGLATVLVGLTLLALTPRVYAGSWLVLPLPIKPWDQVFALARASGRAFWPVGYMLLLAPVAVLSARLRRPWLPVMLGVALALQWIDTGPLRADAQSYYAGARQAPPAVVLPMGARLVSIHPVCLPAGEDAALSDLLRLTAIRDGAALGNMRASRLPHWFACETDLSDGLETPLGPREVRVFLRPAQPGFRQAALGAGAECRAQAGDIVCARGLPVAGTPVPPGPPLPIAGTGVLEGAALQAVLSAGWVPDLTGTDGLGTDGPGTDGIRRFWSEGPRATVLFRPDGPPPGSLRLHIAGFARMPGGTRQTQIAVNGGPETVAVLADGQDTTIDIPVPPGAETVRVTFDMYRPVDPASRGLAAPVRRAALRLDRLEIRP